MSGTVGGVGQYMQGQDQKGASDFNAIQMEREGDIQSKAIRDNMTRLASQQRAIFASRGISVDEGTAPSVIGETFNIGESDAAAAASNARIKAQLERGKGKAAARAGQMALLSGVVSDAGKATMFF